MEGAAPALMKWRGVGEEVEGEVGEARASPRLLCVDVFGKISEMFYNAHTIHTLWWLQHEQEGGGLGKLQLWLNVFQQ